MSESKEERTSELVSYKGLGMALGLVLGGLVGWIGGNLVVFSGGGLVLGLAIGSALDERSEHAN